MGVVGVGGGIIFFINMQESSAIYIYMQSTNNIMQKNLLTQNAEAKIIGYKRTNLLPIIIAAQHWSLFLIVDSSVFRCGKLHLR